MNSYGAPWSLLNGIGVCLSFAIECKPRAHSLVPTKIEGIGVSRWT
jgi:hypothetical protein